MTVEFIQAANQYQSMNKEEQDAFVENVTESLMFVEKEVQVKVLACFYKVNHSLGRELEKRLIF